MAVRTASRPPPCAAAPAPPAGRAPAACRPASRNGLPRVSLPQYEEIGSAATPLSGRSGVEPACFHGSRWTPWGSGAIRTGSSAGGRPWPRATGPQRRRPSRKRWQGDPKRRGTSTGWGGPGGGWDAPGAVEAWERAYAAYRREGDPAAAGRMALWVSTEYAEALGNDAAARGWLARAERLAAEAAPSPVEGWLLLVRAERSVGPADALALAEQAMAVAAREADPDLELAALAHVGLARIRLGDVDAGMRDFEEALAAAAGGEPNDLRTLGDLYCSLVVAGELTLDMSRFMQWYDLVMGFLSRNRHPNLFTFCGTCCAEVVGAGGDWKEGERWLVDTLRTLEETGQRPRCVHPATRLAALRVRQGRLEEAEHLLEGYEDLPEAVQPMVALHQARGQHALSSARLHRRLNEVGRDTLLAAPFLAQLAEVQVARGDAAGAADAVARARAALARSLAGSDPDRAVEEARQALASFERLGATRDADAVARFLRGLGIRGRTGPKAYADVLSKREIEVLPLLGEGLTNAEIAARLFISTKTAGTHVSNVLAKLGLRNRAEAAAYAQRFLPSESASR